MDENDVYGAKKNRQEFFCGKKCNWCSSTDNLELHHVDPVTKKSHRIWSWSPKRREAEISKCIVLCRECHRDFHRKEMSTWVHGIASTYKKGCRCESCRHAQYRTMKTKKKWYNPVS